MGGAKYTKIRSWKYFLNLCSVELLSDTEMACLLSHLLKAELRFNKLYVAIPLALFPGAPNLGAPGNEATTPFFL